MFVPESPQFPGFWQLGVQAGERPFPPPVVVGNDALNEEIGFWFIFSIPPIDHRHMREIFFVQTLCQRFGETAQCQPGLVQVRFHDFVTILYQ